MTNMPEEIFVGPMFSDGKGALQVFVHEIDHKGNPRTRYTRAPSAPKQPDREKEAALQSFDRLCKLGAEFSNDVKAYGKAICDLLDNHEHTIRAALSPPPPSGKKEGG